MDILGSSYSLTGNEIFCSFCRIQMCNVFGKKCGTFDILSNKFEYEEMTLLSLKFFSLHKKASGN
jgi:hypothetical protein